MGIKKIHRTEEEKIKNYIKTESEVKKKEHTMPPNIHNTPENHPLTSRIISLQPL